MKKILIAEPNDFVRDMITSTFENAGFEAISVRNDMEAINRASFSKPDAILIDSFVSRDIYHTVKFMKSHPTISRSIPIMVSTSSIDEAFINGAMDAGATDIIEKPFIRDSLVEKFSTLLDTIPYQHNTHHPLKRPSFVKPTQTKQEVPGTISKQFQQVQYVMKLVKRTYASPEGPDKLLIEEITNAVRRLYQYVASGKQLPIINRNQVQDDSNYLHMHTVNKFFYSLMAAFELGWTEKEAEHLGMAALLTDIGYVKIDRNILRKKTSITKEERNEMQRHVEEGANMLSTLGLPEEIVEAVAFHHERFDGNGYPYGLRAEQINKSAKLLSIIDTFDSLTTWRKHRSEYSSQEAVQKMRHIQGAFDPKTLHDFISTGLCKEH